MAYETCLVYDNETKHYLCMYNVCIYYFIVWVVTELKYNIKNRKIVKWAQLYK